MNTLFKMSSIYIYQFIGIKIDVHKFISVILEYYQFYNQYEMINVENKVGQKLQVLGFNNTDIKTYLIPHFKY